MAAVRVRGDPRQHLPEIPEFLPSPRIGRGVGDEGRAVRIPDEGLHALTLPSRGSEPEA